MNLVFLYVKVGVNADHKNEISYKRRVVVVVLAALCDLLYRTRRERKWNIFL